MTTNERIAAVSSALKAVEIYGPRQYPKGEDRAALCHAAVILAAEVSRLNELLGAAGKVVEAAKRLYGKHCYDSDTGHKLLMLDAALDALPGKERV